MPLQVKNGFPCLFILLLFYGHGFAQQVNQFDDQGNRNGKWEKYYKGTDQLRYEGTFKHGRETGTFKFYEPDSGDQPRATKTYQPGNDTVVLKFFNSDGILKSQGTMVDKKREGEWNYYNGGKENLVMTEHYKNGMKDGVKLVFRKNGKPWQKYHYVRDTLQGDTKTFDRNGEIESEGHYKKGLRNGKWSFYTDGKLDSIATYKMDRLSVNQKKARRKKEENNKKKSE